MRRFISWTAIRFTVAVAAAFMAGDLGVFALPVFVGHVAERYGVSQAVIGPVMSAQLVSAAIAALLIAPRAHGINRRWLALIGFALIVSCDVGSAVAGSLPLYVLTRAGAGLGEGLVQAAAIAVCAGQRNPSRSYSIAYFTTTIMALGVYLVLPGILLESGLTSAFLCIAAAATLFGLTAFSLPAWPAGTARGISQNDTLRPIAKSDLAVIGSYALFYISVNLTWYSMEQLGHAAGLTLIQLGYAVTCAVVLAMTGPLLAWAASSRPSLVPITLALLVSSVAAVVTSTATGFTTFAAGLAFSSACYVFGMPAYLGLAAKLDPSGRLPTALRGAGGFGGALSPTVASASILIGGGTFAVGISATAIAMISLALLWLLSAAVRHKPVIPEKR